MNSRLFIFGLGYTGLALARDLKARGWRISGTCRGAGRATTLAGEGISALAFDGARGSTEIEAALQDVDHILVSVPPGKAADAGDPVLVHFAGAIARSRKLKWLGYLSSTGVYGDRSGGWVDETSPLEPTSARAKRRAETEALWIALAERHHAPVHIFRLAGIYGPGRNQIRNLVDGKARRLIKPGHVFSRIHVEDVVGVLKASMARPSPGAIYNVADDMAAPSAEVIEHAAGLLGVEPPAAVDFDSAGLSPMAQSFYRDCKRVSNERIKNELGIRLAYSTYCEGLEALLPGELQGAEQPLED